MSSRSGAVLSHRSAAQLWGVIRYAGPVEITAHTLDPAALTRAVNDARLAGHLSLDELPPRPTRSAFEDAFPWFCARHRLPQPEINAVVAGYEVGGEDYHDDFEADRAKDADLLEAGLQVVRLSWRRLTTQPEREAARFRTLLGAFPGA